MSLHEHHILKNLCLLVILELYTIYSIVSFLVKSVSLSWHRCYVKIVIVSASVSELHLLISQQLLESLVFKRFHNLHYIYCRI